MTSIRSTETVTDSRYRRDDLQVDRHSLPGTLEVYADGSLPGGYQTVEGQQFIILYSSSAQLSAATALLQRLGYTNVNIADLDGSVELFRAMERVRKPRSAPGSPVPATRLRDKRSVLSRREDEVACLISRGLSNRSIAAVLSISGATVERHVANIFAKLGYNCRSQVATWFVRHELLQSVS
jgi:DNA-binding CsgD family transcriptional regulator